MKILVISNYRETVSVRPEAELFIGLKKMGVEVEIMTYGDAEYVSKFEEAGIKVIDFHPEKKLDRKEINRIRTELIEGKHDILHLFNSKAIINGIQAAKKLPIKIVLYRGYTGNVHWYDPTAYFKYLHPRVDKIWCNYYSVENSLKKQLFLKKEKAVTVIKGHDLNWYENIEGINIDEFYPELNGAIKIICIANNRPVKGVKYLIEAMNYLPPTCNAHLLLIGKNMQDKTNTDLIKNSSFKDKIHTLGFRENALHFVKSSDILVSPSLSEALQKAVIEAMALGIPPIVTDIPGNKGLVINYESGLVVPAKNPGAIANAILNLYNDKNLRAFFGSMAKKRISEHFSLNKTVQEIHNLYQDLTNK